MSALDVWLDFGKPIYQNEDERELDIESVKRWRKSERRWRKRRAASETRRRERRASRLQSSSPGINLWSKKITTEQKNHNLLKFAAIWKQHNLAKK
jgi:hypothetical protein